MENPNASSDAAYIFALFIAYLVAVVWIVWPSSHFCHDPRCERLTKERGGDLPK